MIDPDMYFGGSCEEGESTTVAEEGRIRRSFASERLPGGCVVYTLTQPWRAYQDLPTARPDGGSEVGETPEPVA
jgi:hypothetical protein